MDERSPKHTLLYVKSTDPFVREGIEAPLSTVGMRTAIDGVFLLPGTPEQHDDLHAKLIVATRQGCGMHTIPEGRAAKLIHEMMEEKLDKVEQMAEQVPLRYMDSHLDQLDDYMNRASDGDIPIDVLHFAIRADEIRSQAAARMMDTAIDNAMSCIHTADKERLDIETSTLKSLMDYVDRHLLRLPQAVQDKLLLLHKMCAPKLEQLALDLQPDEMHA